MIHRTASFLPLEEVIKRLAHKAAPLKKYASQTKGAKCAAFSTLATSSPAWTSCAPKLEKGIEFVALEVIDYPQ
jgi:hypothetical protein